MKESECEERCRELGRTGCMYEKQLGAVSSAGIAEKREIERETSYGSFYRFTRRHHRCMLQEPVPPACLR